MDGENVIATHLQGCAFNDRVVHTQPFILIDPNQVRGKDALQYKKDLWYASTFFDYHHGCSWVGFSIDQALQDTDPWTLAKQTAKKSSDVIVLHKDKAIVNLHVQLEQSGIIFVGWLYNLNSQD